VKALGFPAQVKALLRRSADSVEVVLGADEKRTLRNRDRRKSCAIQLIDRETPKFFAAGDHGGYALFAREIYPSVRIDGRGGIVTVDALDPILLSCLCVQACCYSEIADDIKLVTHQERRRRVGRCPLERPRDVSLRDVTGSVRADGNQRGFLKSCGDVNKA